MTKSKLFFFVFVAICIAAPTLPTSAQRRGQQAPAYNYPPQLLEEMKQLQNAALSNDYALKQVAFLSNNIGPRLSGSLQAARAVEYVADEMRKLGLEVRLEKVMVPHWVRGIETGELTQVPGMAAGIGMTDSTIDSIMARDVMIERNTTFLVPLTVLVFVLPSDFAVLSLTLSTSTTICRIFSRLSIKPACRQTNKP